MKRILLITCATIAAASMISGCQKGPKIVAKAAPAPQLQEGWIQHDSGNGFTVAAPDGWKRNPPGAMAGMGLGGEEAQPQAPVADTPSAEEVERQSKTGEVFALFDNVNRPVAGEKLTKFFVKKQSFGGTLEDAKTEGLKIVGNDATAEKVELPIGSAYKLRIEKKTVGGDTITRILYTVVNGDLYTFEFINSNNASLIDNIAQPVMESLRFTGAVG